jgi:coenzyme F420 hydrogenase subunit beta
MTPPGYSRPVQKAPVSALAEAVIEKACPGTVIAPWASTPNVDPLWGPWRQVFTGHARDEDIRYEASSGGALSAVLIHALEEGLVDRVIHVAADPAHPTGNIITCSRTAAEVLSGAGSRYTASSPLAQIDAALNEGGRLAFVGKPCDVSALRSLSEIDPRVARHVPIMLSFFCGGMPAHEGVERILAALGVELQDVAEFRYRGRGWPGQTVVTARSGATARMTYEESWGGFLSKQVQFRCKICADAVGGVADIAFADAWYGGETGYPKFEEQDGRSLVVVRSAAGERLVDAAVSAGRLAVDMLDVRQIDLMQPSQARRKRLVRGRVAALSLVFQPSPRMTGTLVNEAARGARLGESIRNILGTVRRIITGRR